MTWARALGVAAVVIVVSLAPGRASAHPLGNFTINTSAAAVVSPGMVWIDYVVDMAEIPTVQVRPDLDADGNGVVSSTERTAYASASASTLAAGLSLRIDDRPIAVEIASAAASLLPGQGGLDVLRIEVRFVGELSKQAGSLTLDDRNFPGRIGWHEITATARNGMTLTRSDVPATSVSDSLRSYPKDLLASPLDVRAAHAGFRPGTSPEDGKSLAHGIGGSSVVGDRFARLVDRTGPLMLLAVVLSSIFGAVHALGPGHGKTLMAAYLVAAGGRRRQAVAVGIAVATMHTLSVLALGVAILAATAVFAPERIYPWLGVASGVIALMLGAILLVSRIMAAGSGSEPRPPHTHAGAAPHAYHAHGPSSGHVHAFPEGVVSRRSLVALAVAGGILPSPTALVVLLGSVAVHRLTYGLALIAAFSLGLAGALVAVGVLALRARDIVTERLSWRAARAMPIVSAGAITLVGAVLTLNGIKAL
jgi:ABC-type nickel/cobalt efflux system permease component RcnA